MPPDSLAELLRQSRLKLREAGIESYQLDARLLLQHASGLTHEALIAQREHQASAGVAMRLDEFLARRLSHEPVTRILGEREFYGRLFRLNPATLDPRPDTETLVDAALSLRPQPKRILDLGTGTGALIVTLLAELPDAQGVATDVSIGAILAVMDNATRHGIDERLAISQSDWFENVRGRFDLIVSNPPYIPSGEICNLDLEVSRFDPILALDGGDDGLDAYRRIASDAGRFLPPSGVVMVEIGAGQASSVSGIFVEHRFVAAGTWKDLAGHVRCLAFTYASDAAK